MEAMIFLDELNQSWVKLGVFPSFGGCDKLLERGEAMDKANFFDCVKLIPVYMLFIATFGQAS